MNKAIKQYIQHLPNCNLLSLIPCVLENGKEVGCDCGLDRALAELEKQPEPVGITVDLGKQLPDSVEQQLLADASAEAGFPVLIVPKQPEYCKTCGDCKHFMFCTHERKVTHNKFGKCPDHQLSIPACKPEPVELAKELRKLTERLFVLIPLGFNFV